MHVRLAPEALARGLTAGLLACCLAAIGCGGGARELQMTWQIEPTPPVAGAATAVRLTLHHGDGTAVVGARLRLEAHMSHPGMAPITCDVIDRANGAYEARLQLSMAGDWVFVVTGELADGTRITRQIQVPAARPAA
jgi:hypothetical protein